MSDTIIYKLAEQQDKQLLVEYMNKTLLHNVNNAIFDWEYGFNAEASVFTIIRNERDVLGTQGFIPIYLYVQGNKMLTGKSETSFVDAQLRGQNAFEKLYALGLEASAKRGHQLCWGFTLLKKVWRDKLKFEVYEQNIFEARVQLNMQTAFLQARTIAEPNHKKVLRSLKIVADTFKFNILFNLIRYTDNHINFKEDAADNEDIEPFMQKKYAQAPALVRLYLDKAFINWRVYNNPASRYKCFYYYRNHALVGYSIMNLSDKNNAYISDINFEDMQVARHIITHNFNYLKKQGFGYVHYFGNIAEQTGNSIFGLFTKAGAKLIPNENMHFVLKDLTEHNTHKDLFDLKNWLITGLMTEGFRI